MRTERDPYRILGISPNAPFDQVRNAYRKLAKRFHPDLNPDDSTCEEKFKELQWAYEEITESKGYSGQAHRPREKAFRDAPPRSRHDEHPFFSFAEAVRAYFDEKGKK